MAAYVLCPSCQTSCPEGATFCYRCGASLAGAAPGAPAPTPAPAPYPTPVANGYPYPPPPPSISYETHRAIDRTKTGLVLLAIGALIAWLPLIGILGSLLVLVGAILVILGRHAFGPKHARNVGIAIALFVFGFLGALALAGAFVSSVTSAVALPAAEAEPAITGAFGGLLLGALILGVISGLSTVLFIWELLNGTGRALILLSYVVALLLAALIYAMIMPQLTPALSSMFAVSPPDPTSIVALDNQINNLRLLQALPALLEAGAAYVAWSRIDAGQIP